MYFISNEKYVMHVSEKNMISIVVDVIFMYDFNACLYF